MDNENKGGMIVPATPAPASVPTPPSAPVPALCPQCHQPVQSQFYFCPNCGKNLREKPLSASAGAQLGLYAWSIVLPMIAFITVTRWPALRYLRSEDDHLKQIGMIAIGLAALSTIATYWYAYVWIQNYVQASLNDVGNLGGLGGGL